MRVPRARNPRNHICLVLQKFGRYEKVIPVTSTPSRTVPEEILKPDYYHGKEIIVPNNAEIKNVNQIKGMKRSCQLASSILQQVQNFVKPGITTDEIDELVHNLSIEAEAYPSPLRYHGFPKSVCTSVNNVAVHGIPDLRLLENGDIVNVDITVFYKGFHGDCSQTFLVGDVDDKGKELVQVTEECLHVAIQHCGPEVPFREIGLKIQNHAKKHGLTVVPCVLGHGIGEQFHTAPEIYHIENNYPGTMKPGMTFTIEPALTHGSEDMVLLDDNWTLISEDGARVAQAEHTILVTEYGTEILTK